MAIEVPCDPHGSSSLISSLTNAVSEEVKAWQAGLPQAILPIVCRDCIQVKLRQGAVRVKAVYLLIGITVNGETDVLGLWLVQTEGAKFWQQVVTQLPTRCVQDIFIACVDGLKGAPEAIEAVAALVKRCMLCTHHGSVQPEHLAAYLDEFVFRFDHRTSNSRGLLFYGLIQQAVRTEPFTYADVVKEASRKSSRV